MIYSKKRALYYAVAASAAVYVYKQRQAAEKRRRRAKEKKSSVPLTEQEAAALKRKKVRSQAMGALWKMVMPRKMLAPGKDGEGSKQIIAMFLLCLGRIWIMNRTSEYVGWLDKVMMTRNQSDFWKYWKLSLGVAVIASVHRQTYKYVESSLGVIWQRKLTTILHDMYFRNMNYYVCTNGATAASGENLDPAERVTSDVKEVATQMSLLFCEGLYTATAGGFFAYKLGRLYGVRYAIAPYLYLWLSFMATQKAAPVKWGKLMGNLKGLASRYRSSLERITTHHEAIRALKGTRFETALVENRFGALCAAAKDFNMKVIRSGFCDQLAFYWWLRMFVSVFVIGPHIVTPRRSRDMNSLKDLAALRGAIGHQFVMFVQSMIAAGLTAKMLRQAQQLAGSAGRLYELIHRLKELQSNRQSQADRATVEGEHIEFKDVEVMTPTGNILVENLNFSLVRGESLLLTGHNGAGKSSVFRCLGGLWKVRKGTITKPGSAVSGLHQDVFYLPQKPYNVLGNLRDQLTYPEVNSSAESLTDDNLAWILSQVDLSHLMNRDGALDRESNWESALSLGEQQRLAIARLLYHRPRYAILDECTSAVSADMERRMYELCQKLGITYITISHRPVLRAYHHHILTIGIGEKGYSYEPITERSAVHKPLDNVANMTLSELTSKLRNKDGRNRSSSVDKERRDQRSQEFKAVVEKATGANQRKLASRDRGNWRDLLRLLRIGLPRKSYYKVALFALGVVGQSRLLIESSVNGASMMACVFTASDVKTKTRAFAGLCARGTMISLVIAAVEQACLYLKRDLCLEINTRLGQNLYRRFLERNAFYNLMQIDARCSDPDQRIAVDCRDFANQVTDLLPLIKPIIEMVWFALRTRALVGSGVTSLFGVYLIAGTALIKGLMPNFSAIVSEETELEGKYKFVHSRVKTHAESIAFFGGDEREKEIVTARFNKLMRVVWLRLKTNWAFGLVQQAIVREAPMLVQWILRNEYGKQWGSDEELRKDSGHKLNHAQLFLFNATNVMFDALAEILTANEKIAHLSGLVKRISELDSALTACHEFDSRQAAAAAKGNAGLTASTEGVLKMNDVSIVTPKGECLAKGINVEVTTQTPLMVTGPNSSGKTSFFRTLGGLWPVYRGNVAAPAHDGDVVLVPQRIYMVTGTLADQITYPVHIASHERRANGTEDVLLGLLKLVGVSYLADRKDGWDAEMQWEDVLSLGEQQRIGMARLFFHARTHGGKIFGVLDECTSAVSIDVEERLYREAAKLGITTVTISQRLALQEFHTQELRLGESTDAGWDLKSIESDR